MSSRSVVTVVAWIWAYPLSRRPFNMRSTIYSSCATTTSPMPITDIQVSGSSPWGANSTFSPPGKVHRIMNNRWKKNMAPMLATGHPGVRYVSTACGSYGLDFNNKIRRALTIGGPTFIHSIDPCPKGWDYDPKYSHELGMLAVETGIWPLYEIIDGEVVLNGATRAIARGIRKRKPVEEYLMRQGRFAHFTAEDIKFFQGKVDESWEEWWMPGVVPFNMKEG